MNIKTLKKITKKAPVYLPGLLAAGLFIYLVFFPFYPGVKYRFVYDNPKNIQEARDVEKVKEKTKLMSQSLPKSEYAVSPNRLIITKIGVNAPIIQTDNEEYGLSKGAWLVPDTSTPDRGGNTVITGHRFRYLPPNNITFYLFHKLQKGDIVSVIWQEKEYFYRLVETKIVPKTEVAILNKTSKPKLTLFTCDPIWSEKNRLVVIGEPIE